MKFARDWTPTLVLTLILTLVSTMDTSNPSFSQSPPEESPPQDMPESLYKFSHIVPSSWPFWHLREIHGGGDLAVFFVAGASRSKTGECSPQGVGKTEEFGEKKPVLWFLMARRSRVVLIIFFIQCRLPGLFGTWREIHGWGGDLLAVFFEPGASRSKTGECSPQGVGKTEELGEKKPVSWFLMARRSRVVLMIFFISCGLPGFFWRFGRGWGGGACSGQIFLPAHLSTRKCRTR